MTNTQRIAIRSTARGYIVSSKSGGIFGTKIRVELYSTALAIKTVMKTTAFGTSRSAMIDALIRDEACCVPIPASRLHLVVSR